MSYVDHPEENAVAYNPDLHHRRSIRLQGYDYTRAGAYFVTICSQRRVRLFGQVASGIFQPSMYGEIVAESLDTLSEHFAYVTLDAWVVMPNHLHAIVVLDDVPAAERAALGRVVAYLKYRSTTRINDLRGTPALRVWQRNYYDHIIRDASALDRIRAYIAGNPLKWQQDQFHPDIPSK
jgi:REP element-mobilizing transposase RayT